ncbi:MAG: hypothetical protein WD048_09275 [Chitinophagales bacterium]
MTEIHNPPEENSDDKLHRIAKGLTGLLPSGGGLVELFDLLIKQPVSERLHEWRVEVAGELLDLQDKVEGFQVENLKSNEEFTSFLLEASQIAFKTHQKEKLFYLKNSIGNYFNMNTEYDKKSSFLSIVDDLTTTHIDCLLFIVEKEDLIVEEVKGFEVFHEIYSKENPTIDKYFFRKCVRDLENISLIRISGDFRDFHSQGGYVESDGGAPSIKLLDYGKEFIEFVAE